MSKYYCSDVEGATGGVVQIDSQIHGNRSIQLNEEILKLAHEEYARHHRQSFERIQQRGGFSVLEVVALLADHVEHLKR